MNPFPDLNECTVAVIGLGYVGLPLAVELAKPQACARSGELCVAVLLALISIRNG